MDIVSNKRYVVYNFADEEDIFSGYFENYTISGDLLVKLSRSLGFSYDLYQTLAAIDKVAAKALVCSMSQQNSQPSVVLILDNDSQYVVGYSLDYERMPLLNSEFIHRATSQLAANEDLNISEVYYDKDSTISSMLISRISPMIIEEKYIDKPSKFTEYKIGVLLVNDENTTSYTRLVVYVNGQPLYLPASYYNATATRYKRSTANNTEALELLLLKIVDDLRDTALESKLYDFHYKYRSSKYVLTSYEEYNSVLKMMRKIPAVIEETSLLDSFLAKYEEFEKKYTHMEEQKSSYLWRCTALSDISVDALVMIATDIMRDMYATPIEYYDIRDLLGYYISTPRMAEEIAKEDVL